MGRLAVLCVVLVFLLGFAVLTVEAIVQEGVTVPGTISVLVLALLGIGVLGALRPPRRK